MALTALCVAALTAFAGALVGCGGDDNNATTTSTSTTPLAGEAPSNQVAISETDFKLDPANPEVAAGMVKFDVSNDGGVTHSLEVEGPGGESQLEKPLDPGQSAILTVDLSKPGSYEFYCPIDGHKKKGMAGEVTVTAATGAAGAAAPTGGGTTTGDAGGGAKTQGGGGNSGGGGGGGGY